MKERPIIFNDAMVRAILGGRKTQTRRPVKLIKADLNPDAEFLHANSPELALKHSVQFRNGVAHSWFSCAGYVTIANLACPFGQPGDRLWVRQRCWIYGRWTRNGLTKSGKQKWKFVAHPDRMVRFDKPDIKASLKKAVPGYDGDFGWISRPSIHMPRWASRITLEITDVRVERLQDISEEDARAEGLQTVGRFYCGSETKTDVQAFPSAREAFSDLWQSIYGAESWQANPWVWVVEFYKAAAWPH